MIKGLVYIFLFQGIGEIISKFLLPVIPGPVIGLLLLLGFFFVRGKIPEEIEKVGGGILQHLGLLFVPASVGVVLFLPLLRENALSLATILIISVLVTIGVTAGLLKLLSGKNNE